MEKLSKKWKSSINFADWYKPKPKSQECWGIVDKDGYVLEQYIALSRDFVIADFCNGSTVLDIKDRPKSMSEKEWYRGIWDRLKKDYKCKKITIQIKQWKKNLK